MATINGLFGSVNGSAGNLTFSSWKGKNVVKQKAASYNDANSPDQQTQRSKFSALTTLSKLLGPAIRIGFREAATSMTEQNVFMSKNKDAVEAFGEDISVNVDELVISTGPVKPVDGLAATKATALGVAHITYADNSDGLSGLPTDILHLAAVDAEGKEAYTFATAATRASGAAGVDVNVGVANAGMAMQYFAFFKRAKSTQTSESKTVASA